MTEGWIIRKHAKRQHYYVPSGEWISTRIDPKGRPPLRYWRWKSLCMRRTFAGEYYRKPELPEDRYEFLPSHSEAYIPCPKCLERARARKEQVA